MASITEAFQGKDSLQSEFYMSQQTKYQEVEPNRLLPDNIKGNLGPRIVGGTLSNLSKFDPYTGTTTNRFTGAGMGQILQGEASTTQEEIDCRLYQGINGLEQLIRDTSDNPNAPVRCGWRYKKSPGFIPQVAQGALGTRNGPLNNNAPEDKLGNGVQWIWDLRKARKTLLRDIANVASTGESLDVLNNVAGGDLRGRFGFCTTTNRMIPIKEDGTALYPEDTTLNCPKAKIIRNSKNLPARSNTRNPVQILQGANIQSMVDCAKSGSTPLRLGCLREAIVANGCEADGTLALSLGSAFAKQGDTRWDGYLRSQPSFQAYQSRQGANAITSTLFEKNRGNWELALSEVKRLNTAMAARDPYIRVSAQDLCKESGLFDNYDFCSDLTDTTPIASVERKCLQGIWQENNGKPAGTAYPTSKTNILDPVLGSIKTWGEYKNAILQLKEKTLSTDPIVQRTAMNQFYGVRVSTALFTPKNLEGQESDLSPPCLGLGKASRDNQWRAFTKEECDKIKGTFSRRTDQGTGYGECTKPTGGSFSWDCRYLNGRETSTLEFWVDATDGSSLMIDGKNGVRNWNDKSGKGRNLVQPLINSRPLYKKTGGIPGLEFDGQNDSFKIPGTEQWAGGPLTVILTARRGSDKNYMNILGSEMTTNSRYNGGPFLLYFNSTYGAYYSYNTSGGGSGVGFNVPAYQNASERPAIMVIKREANGNITIYYNGQRVAFWANGSVFPWTNALLGNGQWNNPYKGTMYEILMYSEALDDTKRQKVEGYIANKWGVTSELPAGHPYKNRGP